MLRAPEREYLERLFALGVHPAGEVVKLRDLPAAGLRDPAFGPRQHLIVERKLAHWMVKFRFADQDFFEVDPVRYASALGEVGLAAYRAAVAGYKGADSFAVRYARERLAILDGDVDVIVKQLGGDLKNPYQFIRPRPIAH